MVLIGFDMCLMKYISIPLDKFLSPIPSVGCLYFGSHHLILITPEIIKTFSNFVLIISGSIMCTEIPNFANINTI